MWIKQCLREPHGTLGSVNVEVSIQRSWMRFGICPIEAHIAGFGGNSGLGGLPAEFAWWPVGRVLESGQLGE